MTEHEKDYKQPTLPKSFSIDFLGYDSNSIENMKAYLIPTVTDFSVNFPLTRLEGITIAANYAEGLAKIQSTLVSNPNILQPTDTFEGQGVGMAIPLNRSGELKTHIVFGPAIVGAMAHPKPEKAKELTESLLYHELAHATEYEIRYMALGDSMLSTSLDFLSPLEYYLLKLSNHAWDEYFACRIEKLITGAISNKDDLFFSTQKRLLENSTKYRIQYCAGIISGPKLHYLLGADIKLFITALAYTLGDNDGLRAHKVTNSKAFSFIHKEENPQMQEFHRLLLELWSSLGKWGDIRDFLALNSPTISLLNSLGFSPFERDKEVFLEVKPFPQS